MNNNPNIDQTLRAWAARQEPDPARLRALEERIAQQHRQGGAPAIAWPPPARRHHGWIGFAAGVAATLTLVALAAVFAGRRNSVSPLLREEGGLFAGRKLAMARVFCETERLFGTNLQWVAQSGHNAELGLLDDPVCKGRPLLVHLSVVARRVGDRKEWHRVWEADVVARTDGVIELAPDRNPGNRISLWLHRLDDDKAFVETRLELHTPVRLESEASEVLRFGAPRDVTRIRAGDTEYLILQTVSPTGGEPCSS